MNELKQARKLLRLGNRFKKSSRKRQIKTIRKYWYTAVDKRNEWSRHPILINGIKPSEEHAIAMLDYFIDSMHAVIQEEKMSR